MGFRIRQSQGRHRRTEPPRFASWRHILALLAGHAALALLLAGVPSSSAVPLHPSQVQAVSELFTLAQWDASLVASSDCSSIPSLSSPPGRMGITCDPHGFILTLNMSNTGLHGSLPASLAYLTNLEILDLQSNSLGGSIPGPALSSLQALRILNLRHNSLGNSIPAELASLTGLSFLLLGYNSLSGPLPPSLSALSNLQTLVLRKNALSGPIPDTWQSLASLTALDLSYNELSGSFPDALAQLHGLQILSVGSNLLGGTVPAWIGGSYLNLKLLDLGNNNFSGEIPSSLADATNLVAISLDRNQLSGALPSSLGALSNLKYLYAAQNKLSGALPSALGSLISLRALDLSGNAELGQGGPLPDWIPNLLTLLSIRLESCAFTGEMPSALGHLVLLQELYLHNNYLSGPIPDSLCSLLSLRALDLSNNSLSGHIPSCLSTLPELNSLNLAYNLLSGAAPQPKASLSPLYTGNCLDAPAEEQREASASLCTQATAGVVDPTPDLKPPTPPGTPSSSLAPPKAPVAIPLSGGSPDQVFPDFFFGSPPGSGGGGGADTGGDGTEVTVTTIPVAVIQESAGGAALSPPVQPQTVLASAEVGAPQADGAWYSWLRITLVVVLASVLAVLMCAVVMLLAGPSLHSLSSHVRLPPGWSAGGGAGAFLEQLPVTEYGLSKIKKATRNFSLLLGKGSFGSVYLAEDFLRDQPDTRAVVKRANNPAALGEFEFRSKVEELARARHPCCVNLLGYCTGKGERLLVFEYLPNGTLFDRLHQSGEVDPLPWEARVRIAVNVACALEFLHSATPAMVHRAVTSSNILLTADMSAKLSDYGLARGGGSGMEMQPKRRRPTRITRGQVANSEGANGSNGTSAGASVGTGDVESGPSAQGGEKEGKEGGGGPSQNLEKVDVYGFGVVLLELITGHKAMKDVHITSLSAPFLEDPLMMPLMVDAALGGYFNQAELVELGSLARDCVKENPSQRPSMREVVAHMESQLNIDVQLCHSMGDTDALGPDTLAPAERGLRGVAGYSALKDTGAAGLPGGNITGAAMSAMSSAASSFRSLLGVGQATSAPPTPGSSEAGDTESVNSSTLLYITPKK